MEYLGEVIYHPVRPFMYPNPNTQESTLCVLMHSIVSVSAFINSIYLSIYLFHVILDIVNYLIIFLTVNQPVL